MGPRRRLRRPRHRHPTERSGAWVADLPALCGALVAADPAAGAVASRALVEGASAWLLEQVRAARNQLRSSRKEQAMAALVPAVVGTLVAAASTAAEAPRDRVIESLCSDSDSDSSLGSVIAVVRRAGKAVAAHQRDATGIERLAAHAQRRLEARLARPVRADDDWAIAGPSRCRCADCATLRAFLADSSRRRMDWPLAEVRRSHIRREIDDHELPVGHETRRTGRPYTLVLTKATDLFERERTARRRDERDLDRLRQGGSR